MFFNPQPAPLAVRVEISSGTSPRVSGTRLIAASSTFSDHATEVFCRKGYEGASMRDLSRSHRARRWRGLSLLRSKERLLFLIQKHTFNHYLEKLKARLGESSEIRRAHTSSS